MPGYLQEVGKIREIRSTKLHRLTIPPDEGIDNMPRKLKPPQSCTIEQRSTIPRDSPPSRCQHARTYSASRSILAVMDPGRLSVSKPA
jgi:hypothetical protein